MFQNLFVWLLLVVTAAVRSRHCINNCTTQIEHENNSKDEFHPASTGNKIVIDHGLEKIQLKNTGEDIISAEGTPEIENASDGDGVELQENPSPRSVSDENLSGVITPEENRPVEIPSEENISDQITPEGNLPDGIGLEENPPEEHRTGCAVEIETKGGPVRGYQLQSDLSVCAYIDIPYGKIEGRFQAPLEADPWTEAHEKREHTKICPQILNGDTTIGDKNCLVVSIFTPIEIKDAPVLFHIHDGNLQEGSGDPIMFGPEYIVPKGVVLVLPNYRLGPLGYLCLRNSTAPGNAALKDLTLALRWVKNNIEEFGGDPTKITVSGDGKAGALVSLLALSPQSRNLFTKAITESGSVLSPWAIDRDPVSKGLELGHKLCEDGDECKSPYELLEEVSLSTLLTTSLKNGFKFVPCIEENTEEAFLSEAPWRILKYNIINITFLVGSADRSGMHEALEHDPATLEHLNEEHESLLPADLVFDDSKTKTEAANDIRTLYFEDDDISEERKDELTKYYTDALYLGPSVRMARALGAAGATVYVYEFSYVGGLNRERNALGTPVEGAARGDLSGYLFGQEGMAPNEQDENMMNFIMELWISFMKTGQPNSCTVRWNPLEEVIAAEEAWLLIAEQPAPHRGLHPRRLELWTHLYRNHYIDNNNSGTMYPGFLLFGLLIIQIIFKMIKYSD